LFCIIVEIFHIALMLDFRSILIASCHPGGINSRLISHLALLLVCLLSGCGKTTSQSATEQLLTSNAVDRVVAQIDFTALNGQRVYFDDQYIRNLKPVGTINTDYVISSLRQQIMAAGCRIEDRKEDADYIIEARLGAMGSDKHEINYGIPANNLLSSASNVVAHGQNVPAIPELSLAKKEHHIGAAKIGVFAYHRETKEPVWQAGVAADRSRSRQSWILGIGPYQTGTIYEEPLFAGNKMNQPVRKMIYGTGNNRPIRTPPPVNYNTPYDFPLAYQLKHQQQQHAQQGEVEWASHDDTKKQMGKLLEQISEEKPAPPSMK